jgi:cytochrome c oxidase subunit 2
MIADEDLKPGQKRLLDVDNPLVLPEGSKVKVLIAGNDVMHSFFVPSLAVQEYSVPGKLNEVWMDIPLGEKTYYGQCNQICGTNHAYMPVVVKVLSKDKYKQWLEKAKIEFASNDSLSGKEMILADMSK